MNNSWAFSKLLKTIKTSKNDFKTFFSDLLTLDYNIQKERDSILLK